MMLHGKINWMKLAKNWLFAFMIMCFLSCIYAYYVKTAWMTMGTLAAASSLFYVALVLAEFLEKYRNTPLLKWDWSDD